MNGDTEKIAEQQLRELVDLGLFARRRGYDTDMIFGYNEANPAALCDSGWRRKCDEYTENIRREYKKAVEDGSANEISGGALRRVYIRFLEWTSW